ncbi:MAG: urease accessory protein UreD [Pseudomonadota bacterium]
MSAVEAIKHQRAIGVARIGVAGIDGTTRLRTLYQQGCAKLRMPSRDGHDGLEAVFINSSGGVTGGDSIDLSIHVEANATLTLTTQACERAYRSNGGVGHISNRAVVNDGARLLWLPQETILFDGSALHRETTIELAPTAELLMVEPLLLGRSASGEAVRSLSFREKRSIHRDGRLLHAERLRLDGPAPVEATFGFSNNTACASLLFVSPRAEAMAEPLRAIVSEIGGVACWTEGALAGKLSARILAADGYMLRKTLLPAIALLADGAVPKIWMT